MAETEGEELHEKSERKQKCKIGWREMVSEFGDNRVPPTGGSLRKRESKQKGKKR